MQRAGEHFSVVSGGFGQQSEGVFKLRWLLEETVITETLLSSPDRQGTSFLMPYKAYFAENKFFSISVADPFASYSGSLRTGMKLSVATH